MAAAARFWLRRSMVLERFYEFMASRNFYVATACVQQANKDVLPEKNGKKKDFAKMEAYEKYRSEIKNLTVAFKEEHEAAKLEERRRLEEINQGSFSPYEQHKKAVEDIKKYNENKETMRKSKEEQREKRLRLHIQKQKEESDTKQLEKNREMVLKVIEESKSFVTFENLEEKIQEALSKETNHNFAITSDGTKITAKEFPNNLGVAGPGPLAYRAAGLRFFDKNIKESWKTRRKFEDVNEMEDSNESSSSDSSDDDEMKDHER